MRTAIFSCLWTAVVAGCSSSPPPGGQTCPPGESFCSNGCTDTNTDTQNCGACDQPCDLANATATCAQGSCNVTACMEGYADCDNEPWNGCESPLALDPMNCGQCGHVCQITNANVACAAGQCEFAGCLTGFAECLPDGGAVADGGLLDGGCGTNVDNDINNCGGCGLLCQIANGTGACIEGMCTVSMCDEGWANCDGNSANGCETNITTDVNNCGGCGMPCMIPYATATCVDEACQFDSCVDAGYDAGIVNCNLTTDPPDPNLGCTDTMTDPGNCGGCGLACGSMDCSGGQCIN